MRNTGRHSATPSWSAPEAARRGPAKESGAAERLGGMLFLIGVLLLGSGVRILGLGNTDLWGDEAFSVMTALGSVHQLLRLLATGEPHPPLHPLLLVGWLRLFGRSELVARLPSAGAGIAGIAVAMAIARWIASDSGRHAATVAAAVVGVIVSLNPIQVWYSQEARMYAQLSFFAGLSALALLRLWRERRGARLLYVVAILGAAGSHYYGLFVPLAHGLALLPGFRAHRAVFGRWLRTVSLAALLYLPWVIVAFPIFSHYYGARPGTVDLPSVALSGWMRLAAGWSLSPPHEIMAAAIVSAMVGLGLIIPPRSVNDAFTRRVLVCWLFTPFVGGYLVSLVRPMYAERYFVVSSLPIALLAGRSILNLPGWARLRAGPFRRLRQVFPWLATAGAALLLLAASIGPLVNVWRGRYLKSAYNTHMRMVTALAQPGDAVILDGTSQLPLYQYYLRKPFPTFPLPDRLPLDPSRTARQLDELARTYQGAWIFLYATPDYDPGYFIPRWLTAHAYRSFDIWEVNGRLQYYRFQPAPLSSVHPVQLRFGQLLTLREFAWQDGEYRAGETIPIDLRWTRQAGAPAPIRIALRLVDQTGFTWAQTDQDVGGGELAAGGWSDSPVLDDHHGLMIPLGTPPGSYRLILATYVSGRADNLPVSGSGAEIGPAGVTLGVVRVTKPAQSVWTDGIPGYHPISARIGGQIDLMGSAGSDWVAAGGSGYLTLIWRARFDHPTPSRLQLSLLDDRGVVAEQRDLALATAGYPVDLWRTGDVLRQQYRLPIRSQLAPGRYRLVAQLPPFPQKIEIGSLVVEPGLAPTPVTPPTRSTRYILGGVVALDGFDLGRSQAAPGTTVTLALHWRDLAPLDDDYTVFVHVLDRSEKVIAQRDQAPLGGLRPTSSWFPGDVVVDRYLVTLPPGLAPGRYPIEVGMYRPTDGHRLPVTDGATPIGDRIILTGLLVKR